MLGDQVAVGGDQGGGSVLLLVVVIPGAGELHLHLHVGADGLGAQVEGGVAGDHLSVGVGAHIAHHGLLALQLAVGLQLVQLQTGGNARQVAALIDGSESIVEVGQALGVGHGASGMAELHVGVLAGSLQQVGLMAEAVGEDDVAAFVHQIQGGVSALLGLGDVALDDDLILAQAQGGNSVVHAVDEVQVIGGVLVVQQDDAQLHVGSLGRGGEDADRQAQRQREQQGYELFHGDCPPRFGWE